MRPNITGCILAVSLIAQGSYAEKLNLSQTGHIKYQLTHTDYADNSIFAQLDHDKMTDQLASFRYNINAQNSHWQLDGHYEVGAVNGDTAALRSQSPEFGQRISLLPSDKNRLLNMTQTLHEGERSEVVHRIDRLSVGYQTERHVVKVGRQVISWGNGFFYAPMDFFNPFAPDAIDKEYKTGDDLLYYQSSFKNGDDLQAVWVGRRDEHGDVTAKVDSVAAKYHGFWGNTEVDLLASQHFEDYILGTGAIFSIGGGILRGDVLATQTSDKVYPSFVANYSYSWSNFGKNMTGAIEYFHNGFGISNGDYSPENIQANPDLSKRIARGELFTLAKNYLAGSVSVEVTPLWMFGPNVFYNTHDQSALVQLSSRNDLREDILFLAALNIPIGPSGTEFGGIETGINNTTASSEWSLFAQLAWYF